MNASNQCDVLYNAVLKTVKEHGAQLEIGLVRAVLSDLEGAIASKASCSRFDTICNCLTEKQPRKCSQHSRSDG